MITIKRSALFRVRENVSLDKALEADSRAPAKDVYRAISPSMMDSVSKSDYSPEFTFHCVRRVRKNLFDQVGVEQPSLGGPAKGYHDVEFPKIDFK